MNLRQAFTQWAVAPRNTVLAAKSRDAVQKVLLKRWGDIDLESISETFARRIFRESNETLELQVKAASILVYVLSWGGDHGYCQRPAFTYEIASEEWKARQPEQPKPERTPMPPTLAEISGKSIMPPAAGEKPLQQVAEDSVEQTMRDNEPTPQATTDNKPEKTEDSMEQNETTTRRRGKEPRSVVQIDPESLQVIKTFDSIVAASKAVGMKDISKGLSSLQRAGGYYWAYAEKADETIEQIRQKQSTTRQPKPKAEKKPKSLVEKFHEQRQQFEQMKQQKQQGATAQPEPAAVNYTLSPEPLSRYSDDDLLAELDRRGWQGELRRTQVVTIGSY